MPPGGQKLYLRSLPGFCCCCLFVLFWGFFGGSGFFRLDMVSSFIAMLFYIFLIQAQQPYLSHIVSTPLLFTVDFRFMIVSITRGQSIHLALSG